MNGFQDKANFIWGIAELLRGSHKQHEYGNAMLPFVVLRRLDCVLNGQRDEVRETYERFKDKLDEDRLEKVVLNAAGDIGFFNVSAYNLERLSEDAKNLKLNFNAYANGFSSNVREILENFDLSEVVDKLDKQGKDAVIAELGAGRTDRSGDKIKGVGLTDKQIAEIEKFLDAASGSGNALDTAESLLGSVEVSAAGISDLKAIESHLSSMNIDKSKTKIDLTIVRGLAYYTGPVFETTLLDLPEFGSVFSGGRYDNLVSRFTGQKISGTGASIGVDRLLAALIELKALKLEQSISKVLVTVMDPECLPDYLKMLYKIREAGIPSEIYVGDSKNITKQVKYADKVGIPFVVIVGSDEFAAGQVTIKNLKAGQEKAKDTSDREEWLKAEEIQVTISADKMVEYLKKELG
ncbi:MAG: ATP phosphoribosyltransferase regulatory subunit [candidate division Zixibacteria bacterium]|nr:ATP phosphoribosyltransferase regulatory subunit [candidate division Zixibacteria bacterium]